MKDVKDNDNTTEDTFPSNILGKLLLMCRKEWPLLFLGWFGAFGLGLILPAYAFVFGNVLMVKVNNSKTKQKVKNWLSHKLASDSKILHIYNKQPFVECKIYRSAAGLRQFIL